MPQYVPVLFQIPAPYSKNPWVTQAFNRQLALDDDLFPADVWLRVVEDFKGHEEPIGTCACGGQYWYRATTGGHKCPECGTFTTPAGIFLGITKARAADYV
jgi:hypothetical protein